MLVPPPQHYDRPALPPPYPPRRQAALTGEAMPVEKSARVVACQPGSAPPPLLECRCLGLMGTHVVSGE